jgi:hypothetical protein
MDTLLHKYISIDKISKLPRRQLIELLYDFLNQFSYVTPQVVDVLPDLILDNSLLIYDNELWRGLAEGESSLPAGTPWPAKGFKSFIAVITDQPGGTEDHELKVFKSNIGAGTFTKHSNQVYRIQFDDIPSSVYFYVPYQNYPQPFGDLPEFMSASVHFNPLNNLCNIGLWKPFQGDDETLLLHLNAMFFPPPPDS